MQDHRHQTGNWFYVGGAAKKQKLDLTMSDADNGRGDARYKGGILPAVSVSSRSKAENISRSQMSFFSLVRRNLLACTKDCVKTCRCFVVVERPS